MEGKVAEVFGGRIRIRVCGICFRDDRLLLINHSGIYGHDFWAPPGGGVNFGESLEEALKREFFEECKTEIIVGNFLFGCEFIKPPLHALELFYEVTPSREPQLGTDPELVDHQVISGLKFMNTKEVKMLDKSHVHGLLNRVENIKKLKEITGFFNLT